MARIHRSWLAVSLLLSAIAFAGDVATGTDLSFAPFYLVSIAIATWRVGRPAGVTLALLSAGAWAGAERLGGRLYARPHVFWWNLVMELAVFLIVALGLARIRDGMLRQRELSDQLETAYTQLDHEMRVVGDLQRDMLPAGAPELPGYRFAVHYATSTRSGGDYYDFFPMTQGREGVLIADASGHGAPAAVLMAMTRTVLRGATAPWPGPEALIDALHEHLQRAIPVGQFVTACCAALDPSRGTLEVSLAGHPPPLLARPAGEVEILDGPGRPPLGIPVPGTGASRCWRIERGEVLLLYTDGLTEARSPDGEMLGEERVRSCFARCRREPADRIRDRLAAELDQHTHGAPLADDVTILVVART